MNLFDQLLEHKKEIALQELQQSMKSRIIHLGKDDVIDEGIFKFKHLKRSGFCTFYTGLSFWNIKSDYFKSSREASKRVDTFTRVIILRDTLDLDNSYLIHQIREDLLAHANIYLCHYDDIEHADSKKDFGLWDDEYLCIVHYDANNTVTGITISGKEQDLRKGRKWSQDILRVATPITSLSDIEHYRSQRQNKQACTHDRYREFQLRSIESQMAIASKQCRASYVDPYSCQWYHSSWPILRALNVVSTPNWHGSFYIKSIQDYLAQHKHRINILICATADATILEHVEAGLGDISKANIWVIDLCPTPLEIAREYARLRNSTIHTLQANALSMVEDGIRPRFFDLVITDAFLTRFADQSEKNRVIHEWSRILKKGGQVVTTCRITGQKREQGSAQQIKTFITETLTVFDQYTHDNPDLLKYINRPLTKHEAQNYAEHIVSHPLSEQDVVSLFDNNGFDITIKKLRVRGEFKPTTYAQIIASKNSKGIIC